MFQTTNQVNISHLGLSYIEQYIDHPLTVPMMHSLCWGEWGGDLRNQKPDLAWYNKYDKETIHKWDFSPHLPTQQLTGLSICLISLIVSIISKLQLRFWSVFFPPRFSWGTIRNVKQSIHGCQWYPHATWDMHASESIYHPIGCIAQKLVIYWSFRNWWTPCILPFQQINIRPNCENRLFRKISSYFDHHTFHHSQSSPKMIACKNKTMRGWPRKPESCFVAKAMTYIPSILRWKISSIFPRHTMTY